MDEQYQCIGCGAMIQNVDPNQIGYLPPSAFEKGKETGEFYCRRCFRLRHYNELQDLSLSEDDFLDKLNAIGEESAFVIHVIDIFDVEGTLLTGLSRMIDGQPFVVVANKLDILPKSVKKERIRHWLKVRLNSHGMYPEDVLLISAAKHDQMASLISLIEKEIKRQPVYIVGVTNVGKSTIINQLIRYYGGESNIITTSNFPGTTLDLIEIPVDDYFSIFDTPGIVKKTQLIHLLNREDMKQVMPVKTIKPRTFQLNPEQTIFFGGLVAIDFIKGEKTSFTFYMNNDLYLHRTKTNTAVEFYKKHKGHLLTPPSSEVASNYPELTSVELTLKQYQDLLISSLGWVTVNQPVRVRLHYPKQVHYTIRPSMI